MEPNISELHNLTLSMKEIAEAILTAAKNLKNDSWSPSVIVGLIGVIIGPIVTLIVLSKNLKAQQAQMERQLNEQKSMLEHQLQHQFEQAERELKANIVSKNRQNWINELRSDLAKFVSLSSSYIRHKSQFVRKIRKTGERPDLTSEFMQEISKISEVRARIELRLNPKEELHKNLIDELHVMLETIQKEFQQNDDVWEEFREIRDTIIKYSQAILKSEWERVKMAD